VCFLVAFFSALRLRLRFATLTPLRRRLAGLPRPRRAFFARGFLPGRFMDLSLGFC
jgi:hypothetical protein